MPTLSRFSRAERLALATAALALVHHIDHALRVDHGWPFRAGVTPFTYSLLVYVIVAVVLLARGWPWLRIGLSAGLALVPTLAHAWLESPSAQFVTWAARPEANWLGVSSPLLGVAAVLVTVLLPLSAAGVFVAFVRSRGV